MNLISKAAVAFLFLGTIVFYALWYPHLPEMIPSRYGPGGEISQRMARNNFVALMGGISLGMLVMFSFLLPLLLRVLPISLINVPHREYYLSEPRREETLAFVSETTRWIAIAIVLFLLCLSHLSFEVATGTRKSISPYFGIAMALYLLANAVLVARLYFRFRKPMEPEAN